MSPVSFVHCCISTGSHIFCSNTKWKDASRAVSNSHHGNNEQNRQDSPEKSALENNRDSSAIAIPDKKVEREEEKNLRFSQLPGRSKMILILLASANFFAECGYSLLAPFFPQEAKKKGVSGTVTGLIFSSFEFIIFLSSPIFGNYLSRIGERFVMFSGIFVCGCCAILFGTLDKSVPGNPFIVICFLCRCIEALALSAFITASLAIIIREFPQHVATVYGIMETSTGMGLMVGPALGGVLYELGGFGMPFFVMGALILLCGAVSFKLLPATDYTQEKRKASIWSLLLSPLVWIAVLNGVTGGVGITFLEPTLSAHLKEFHLSTVLIGLLFVIVPGLYAMTSPLWGYLSDKRDITAPLIIVGNLVCGLGFLFIGPSPFLPFLPFELWVNIIGLILMGFCIGCAVVPTMKCLVNGAVEVGFENNLDTFGIVSGFFNSVYCFGAFLGPTVGGALVQELGFQYAYTVMSGLFFFMMLCTTVFFSIWYLRGRRIEGGRHTEYQTFESQEPTEFLAVQQSIDIPSYQSVTDAECSWSYTPDSRRRASHPTFVRSVSHTS